MSGEGAAVSRFGIVEPADLPVDLRERISVIAEKSGFVPNVFRALAVRPDELRAFLDYHDALMDRSDGLSKAERELIVVATSGANHWWRTARSCGSGARNPSWPTRWPPTHGRVSFPTGTAPLSTWHC